MMEERDMDRSMGEKSVSFEEELRLESVTIHDSYGEYQTHPILTKSCIKNL